MILSLYLVKIIAILSKVWPLIVLGIIFNLLIELFMPKKIILSNFKKKDFLTILRAAVSGFLISGLSFKVIPIVVSLRKEGASAPACASMLAFSPWTGVLGLMILGGYLGFSNLLILLGYSFLISIILGVIFSIIEKYGFIKSRTVIEAKYLKENNYANFGKYLKQKATKKELFLSILNILKNVSVAILFTAFFEIIFSPSFIASNFSTNYSILFALPFATLIEIIGEGFSLFAGEMYLLGANLGFVFAVMMAGVITDINELTMLANIFSKKAATAYLLISLALVLIFSYILI